MDAFQYEDYGLTLLFIKYVADQHSGNDDLYADLEVPWGKLLRDGRRQGDGKRVERDQTGGGVPDGWIGGSGRSAGGRYEKVLSQLTCQVEDCDGRVQGHLLRIGLLV